MRPIFSILGAIAGLMGAAGVGLSAAASHLGGGDLLKVAADFLLIHAAAVIGAAAWGGRNRPSRLMLSAASLLALGPSLFALDLSLRVLADLHPVPMMAPTGGSLSILGWLVLSAAALRSLRVAADPPGGAR